MIYVPLDCKDAKAMMNFTVDPRLEQSEPFTKRAFQTFRDKLPQGTYGTHAGLTVLLEYLLDLSDRHASVDRWFRCTQQSVETDLGLVPTTQERLIHLLETMGYLESRQIGSTPSVRYLRTNLDAIEHDLLAEPAPVES